MLLWQQLARTIFAFYILLPLTWPRSSSIDLGAETAGSKVSWPCWKGDLRVAWVYWLQGGYFIGLIFNTCRFSHVFSCFLFAGLEMWLGDGGMCQHRIKWLGPGISQHVNFEAYNYNCNLTAGITGHPQPLSEQQEVSTYETLLQWGSSYSSQIETDIVDMLRPLPKVLPSRFAAACRLKLWAGSNTKS